MFRTYILALVLANALLTGAYSGRNAYLIEPADAQGLLPAIPDNLRPYLRDYITPTATLCAGFIPYKPRIVWGEPLEATLRIENLGPKDFPFDFGGDYRGIGRHERIQILVTDASGKPLNDPHANALNFGGILTREVLTPGGPCFQYKIDLTQYRTFEKPGEYTVTCSFAFEEPPTASQNAPAGPVVRSQFPLTIVDRTPDRVVAIMEEMAAQAQAAPQQDLPAILERIARFGREDAAPPLIRLAHTGASERRAAAIAVMPLVPAPAVVDAAIAALQDPDPTIRMAAAGALGTMALPRAVEALLQALPREKASVAAAVLVALGASKSDRALSALQATLDHGSSERRQAAVNGFVAYGGEAAIAALEKHVTSEDLSLRYQVILALVEKLHQPLKADWLLPILRGRTQSPEWLDTLRLVRMYAGEEAIPLLCRCLDFDAAWSGRNAWVLYQVQACPNAPPTDYIHDWNREGTPAEVERNRRTLAALKKLAEPIPSAPPRRIPPRPYLKTDPPIDFAPQLKSAQDRVEITSGFLHITLSRTSLQQTYSPSEPYHALYELAQRLRGLVQHPDRDTMLGITALQAGQLRALSPPEQPDLTGCIMLYMIYKESPAGPLQQEAEDNLNEAIRGSSESYHAAVAAFVESARKILSKGQWDRL